MDDHTASAANALTHGLTARDHLPAALTASIDEHLARLELDADGHVQNLLRREVARHAAFLDVAAAAEQAALRIAAASTELGAALVPCPTVCVEDSMLASAAASDQLERIGRYRRAHEKGFLQAVRALLNAQTAAHTDISSFLCFSEEQCRAYLANRLRSEDWRCPRCSSSRGAWLKSRERRECGDCSLQAGVRSGTVFEKSALPLSAWFSATVLMATHKAVTLAELERVTGLRRRATLRRMHRVILAALSDSKADQLLAGLPAICRARLPEQSVPSEKRSAKRAARTSLSSSHRTDLAHENLRAVRDAGRDGPNLNQALESKED